MTTATVTETCVELANGRHLDLADPDPEVLDLEVIATGLAVPRWSNQLCRPVLI